MSAIAAIKRRNTREVEAQYDAWYKHGWMKRVHGEKAASLVQRLCRGATARALARARARKLLASAAADGAPHANSDSQLLAMH